MKEIYSTKELNPAFYMVLGIDDDYPVLYVYKDGELFDYHFSIRTSFSAEMKNTIDCFRAIHNLEPAIEDLLIWRSYFKSLKEEGVIS